jgi:hypothetical protein
VADGGIIQLTVRGARISIDADWLSAAEQFGGVFIYFDESAECRYLRRDTTAISTTGCLPGTSTSVPDLRQTAELSGDDVYSPAQLAQVLIRNIVIKCRYPASSLNERAYARSSAAAAGITIGAVS